MIRLVAMAQSRPDSINLVPANPGAVYGSGERLSRLARKLVCSGAAIRYGMFGLCIASKALLFCQDPIRKFNGNCIRSIRISKKTNFQLLVP
jgi:hypothetical protein